MLRKEVSVSETKLEGKHKVPVKITVTHKGYGIMEIKKEYQRALDINRGWMKLSDQQVEEILKEKPELAKPETIKELFDPLPISGGYIIAKSVPENMDYYPGPEGGTSSKHRTNIWDRRIYILWRDGSIEGFDQMYSQRDKPKRVQKGRGEPYDIEEVLADILNKVAYPMKGYIPKHKIKELPTGYFGSRQAEVFRNPENVRKMVIQGKAKANP